MDTLTFIAEIVKAAAWPITIVTVTVLFRPELNKLLRRLKKGKVGSAEFEFQEEVKELEKDIAVVSTIPQPVELKEDTVNRATLNPRGAMLIAWIEIENALISLAQKHNLLDTKTRRNPSALVQTLVRADLIPRAYGPGFLGLYRLRNQAAHEVGFNPDADTTLGYLKVAEELKQIVLQSN